MKKPNVDPDVARHVYAGVAIAKVLVALGMWFIYFENGNSSKHPLKKMYWRAWFSGFLAVMGSWGPVILFYGLSFIGDKWARKGYMWTCMLSVDGPMLGYALPLVFLIIGYLSNKDEGLDVTSPIHFWMGWTLLILIMVVSFTFQIAFLPSIRVWFEADGDYSIFEEEEEDEESNRIDRGEDDDIETEVVSFDFSPFGF